MRRPRRRRAPAARAAFLLLLAAAAAAGAGCGGRSGERGDGSAGKLLFWQFWDPALLRPAIASFEREHPGVTVEIETLTWQSGFEKILLAMTAGRPPDLLELGSTWVARFAAEGALTDLSGQVVDLVPQLRLWEPAVWEDRVYALPWLVGTRAVFYNRALFRRAGLDPDRPPATWEAFRAAAAAVDALGPEVYGFGLNAGERYVMIKKFLPFAWGNGGRVLSPDGAHAELDTPANREALEFYLSLGPHSLREKQDVLDRAFAEGRVGMIISGGWNLANLPRDAPALDFGVALLPRPAADRGTPASFAGAEMLAVPSAGRQAQLALALARHLVRAENAALIARGARSVLPAAVGSEADSTLAGDAGGRAFVAQLAAAQAPPAHPRWQDMESAIDTALEEALYGRLTAAEALARAHREVEAIAAGSAARAGRGGP